MTPFLSIVVVGRNDNYGGDFNFRLQNQAVWLNYIVEKEQLPTELIIVNYNPLPDEPSMLESINWPTGRHFLSIRFINVPNEIHQSLYHQPDIRKPVPVYEYIGKNIGIRRAKGQYILASNPDIIYHPYIFRLIKNGVLNPYSYYRADRCDYKRDELGNLVGEAEELELIKARVFKAFLKGYIYDFQSAPRIFDMAFRWLQIRNSFRLRKEILKVEFEKISNRLELHLDYDNIEYYYHCNAGGDFMMMHRDALHELHGCPENTYLSLHTDSLVAVMAGTSGLKERIFSVPIFHCDHERRYDAAAKNKRTAIMEKMYRQMQDDGKKMHLEQQPIIYNDENWGAKGLVFAEDSL